MSPFVIERAAHWHIRLAHAVPKWDIAAMAITILAGQDLVAALHRGTLGSPPWEEFLDGLRRRTGADFAGIFLSSGQNQSEIVTLEAGRGAARFLSPDRIAELAGAGPSNQQILRAKRVYSSGELTDSNAAACSSTPSTPHSRIPAFSWRSTNTGGSCKQTTN